MAISERDVLRKVVRYMKNKYGVEISKAELNSIESCYTALDRCVHEANEEKLDKVIYALCNDYRDKNFYLTVENKLLKKEIQELKAKKSLWRRIFG